MGSNKNPKCACPWCNRPGVIPMPVAKRGGGNAYFCAFHGRGGLDGYNQENPIWYGKPHAHCLTYATEFEVSDITMRGRMEMCANSFRLTSDCTVRAELKSPIYQSLSAPVAYSESIDRMIKSGDIVVGDNCGTHFHVGRQPDRAAFDSDGNQVAEIRWKPIDADTMAIIRRYYVPLFTPLFQYWWNHEEESTAVFGRSWGEWADTWGMQDGNLTAYDGAMEHRLAVNVQHDATIEFRRCRYRNAAQYRRAMYGCSAVVEKLTECLTEYETARMCGRRMTWARKTGQKLVKAWCKGIDR